MRKMNSLRRALGAAALLVTMEAGAVQAQVPADIEAGLLKIGQVVDPACTAKLYRPLMPAKDYNTYWPVGAPAPVDRTTLYPGVTIMRDQSFGPNPKDVLDVFIADKGGDNRTILMYVPGGGGNKIEQQDRDANAFYDNIGRWAAKNGMVGVTVQRHPGRGNWDDGGRDISMAVDYAKANAAKFHGNPNRIFIWAHSAGNGPTGVYVGHPERWKNGVQVKGAIFMSGNPVPGVSGPAAGGDGRGAVRAGGAPAAGGGAGRGALVFESTCGAGAPGAADGAIAGPGGQTPAAPRGGGPGGPGGIGGPGAGGGRAGGQALTPEQQTERDNLPGFKMTATKILLARAEWDPGVIGAMAASDIALHDELCKLDGPKARDGVGHCPVMLYLKGESHMSEVFSIDTPDKTVSGSVLDFIKRAK
jgi:hypothetical protein